MEIQKKSEATKGTLCVAQSLINRIPLGALCLEVIYDEQREIADYVVVGMNRHFEVLSKVCKEEAIGKRITDAFVSIDAHYTDNFKLLSRKALENSEMSAEAHISIFDHIYKASFFYIIDTLLVGVFEDVQPQLFRRCYRRAIPHNVIARSIAEKGFAYQKVGEDTENGTADENLLCIQESVLQIIPRDMDYREPFDLAFRDSLTGLYDRLFALEALRMYVDRGAVPLSIAIGDINGLRSINESMGYETGDEILTKVAKVIQKNCRTEDIIARWGDDSFILILPFASQRDTQVILTRLQKALDSMFGENNCLITFGYAANDNLTRNAEDLIREAEKWTYQKKLLVNQSHRSGTIRLLLSMLREKSVNTQEHSGRIADHCRRIAEELALSDEMINDLLLLAMLHDIGKVGIPERILNKPGPLTPEERALIEMHPEIGYRISQTIPELANTSLYILAHHERWDGTGYPRGLGGEEIPLASRIIAVVDAYDVIVTGRNYRPARSKEEAITELKQCAGTQFDPKIVETYVKLLEPMNNDSTVS